jgi:hypothetical protein
MGNVARIGKRRSAYRGFMGSPDGRRPPGRPRFRWESDFKLDLQEMGWGAWTGSIWLRIETSGALL